MNIFIICEYKLTTFTKVYRTGIQDGQRSHPFVITTRSYCLFSESLLFERIYSIYPSSSDLRLLCLRLSLSRYSSLRFQSL